MPCRASTAIALTRFSEEYQEDLYRRRWPCWRRSRSGAAPRRGSWSISVHRAGRCPVIQDGWNRKGLIGENGVKKKAFFVLRDFYLEDADAHAGGH